MIMRNVYVAVRRLKWMKEIHAATFNFAQPMYVMPLIINMCLNIFLFLHVNFGFLITV